ncbi:unnamed protein product [Urochloa humidicola]
MMLEPLRPVPPALVDVTGSARPRAPGGRSRADEPKVWAAAAELRAGVGGVHGRWKNWWRVDLLPQRLVILLPTGKRRWAPSDLRHATRA